MRPSRGVRILFTAALGSALLAACGGGGGSDSSQGATTTAAPKVPAACKEAPVTVDLRAEGEHPAGSKTFEATDAVARRVAILPGEMAFDPADLSGLEKKAGVTPLALYTLYLADFEIPRTELSGVGFGQITPADGQTVGAITIVPLDEGGFAQGDTAVDGKFGYDLTTTLTPVGVTVFADGDTTGQAYTDTTGQVEILQLDDKTICMDFDLTFENQGETVYAAKGTVLAPVVRSADAFFYT